MPPEEATLNDVLAASYKKMTAVRAPVVVKDKSTSHDSEEHIRSRAAEKLSTNDLCQSCYELVPWILPSEAATISPSTHRFRHICDLKMASRTVDCPLCTFFFDIASEAGTLARLPGAHKFAMFSLHMSTFQEAFFHAEDHCWFPEDKQSRVFFISPLYTSGDKARNWAVRYKSCFMVIKPENVTVPFARLLGPQVDLDVVKSWVAHCHQHHTHPDCNPPEILALEGFRVIDCNSRKTVLCPRDSPYVTLSYVWGDEPPGNIESSGTILEALPRLIEDVIQVSLELGYQYLWVDRYCVPQDDQKAKSNLIRNMNKIYADSSVTIIASASQKPSDGLVGVSTNRTRLPQTVQLGPISLSQLKTNLAEEVQNSKWNSRGWTYQEGFLSNKRLVFTESQCYFQCGELCCFEGLHVGLDTLVNVSKPFHALAQIFPWISQQRSSVVLAATSDRRGKHEAYFIERVREYMRRELTHDSDAFLAFSGVLNYLETFAEEFLLGNVLGLPIWTRESRWSGPTSPKDALLRSISWSLPFKSADWPANGVDFSPIAKRRQGLPSWTWCGWKPAAAGTSFIEWEDVWGQPGLGSILFLETKISIELGCGKCIDWEQDGDPVHLLAAGEAEDDPRYLRVSGWVSELFIPAGCWNDGPATCQCGPYRLHRQTARFLSLASMSRGLPVVNQGYMLSAWFHSPLVFSDAEDNCCGNAMILLGATRQNFHERLQALCKIEMNYFTGRPSIKELAHRFGWNWMQLKIA